MKRFALVCLLVSTPLAYGVSGGTAWAQPGTADPFETATQPAADAADAADPADLADPAAGPRAASAEPAGAEPPAALSMDLLSLLIKGGWLMLPIALMSVIVIMLAVERAMALRRRRVIPDRLLEGLADLGSVPGVMDPRRAYRLCHQYPSAAADVIRAMLLKIGRPHSEVEHAVAEASEREAERLFGNVRWLNLIAAVAPLTGLLGTVWGMIRAFYDTTQMAAGQNKADFLAEGIYIALVTTLGGLVVAIPAAVFAHYFEGRVIKLFHEIDELLFNLMPQIERYEGRMRVTPHTLGSVDDPIEMPPIEPPPVQSVAPTAEPRRNPAQIG
jgi:biopolymer transport protein ExbB